MSSSQEPENRAGSQPESGARATQIHGSLVEVRGLGVLILGRSGVGKSECVIELIRRGERLVADDVVRLRAEPGEGDVPGDRIIGWSPEHIRHYIEVRGLGLMSIADLFGPERTLDECEVGFVVRLEDWDKGKQFERIGIERDRETILDVEIPCVVLPVHAASNLSTLIELAIRDWRLREQGVNAAARLDERLRSGDGTLSTSESAASDSAGSKPVKTRRSEPENSGGAKS